MSINVPALDNPVRHCEGEARGNLLNICIVCLFVIFFAACGNDNTAGVITETESGQQVAGVVYGADGKPASGVEVYAVNRNSIRAVVKRTTVSEADGSFVIDSLDASADSSYNIFAETKDGLAAVKVASAGDCAVNLNLAKVAQVVVLPSAFNMDAGDTLCFVGTALCEGISEEGLNAGSSLQFEVPAMHLDSVAVISKNLTSGYEISVDAVSDEIVQAIPFDNTSFVYVWNKNVPQGNLIDSRSIVDSETNSDSSLFVMFWLKLDGSAQSDTAYSVLSVSNEKMGLNVRQCTDNKKMLCTRITSGLGALATDTTRFGGEKIMDGTWHHYAVAVYARHLTIVVDGKVERNTDIKLSSEFYSSKLDFVSGFKSADGIENLVIGFFDKSILGSGTAKWDKMSAWIQTEYLLQKQVYGY